MILSLIFDQSHCVSSYLPRASADGRLQPSFKRVWCCRTPFYNFLYWKKTSVGLRVTLLKRDRHTDDRHIGISATKQMDFMGQASFYHKLIVPIYLFISTESTVQKVLKSPSSLLPNPEGLISILHYSEIWVSSVLNDYFNLFVTQIHYNISRLWRNIRSISREVYFTLGSIFSELNSALAINSCRRVCSRRVQVQRIRTSFHCRLLLLKP